MSNLPLVLIGGWGIPAEAVASVARYWPGQVITISVHDDPAAALAPETWVRHQLARVPVLAVWAGWSLGGQLAMLAARLAPQQVAGVVTFCSTPRFIADEDWRGMPRETFDRFSAGVAANPVRAWKRFLLLQVHGDSYEAEGRAAWQPWLKGGPAWPRDSLLVGLGWLSTLDERLAWRQCRVPSHHYFGGHDKLVDPGLAHDCMVDNATLVTGMAHWPFGPHADLLARRLQQFGQSLKTGAAAVAAL